jgi:hypothetical protein
MCIGFSPPVYAGALQEVFMVCHQVLVRFTFRNQKTVLVSISQKQVEAKEFLVTSGLLFGHCLKYRRFFATKKEAAQYTAYLHKLYPNHTIFNPASFGSLPKFYLRGFQNELF